MEENEYIPSDTLPGDSSADSSDGDETGSVSVKDVLGKTLGKEFNSDDSALKYVKDNLEFVGKARNYKPLIEKAETKYGGQSGAYKVMEQVLNEPPKQEVNQVDTSNFVTKDQFDEALWYKENKEFESFKGVISAVQKTEGYKSPSEALEKSESLKGVVEKARAYDSTEKSKSVLQTNSRLGQVTDKLAQARQAQESGDRNAAVSSAVSAVIDAYEL